jgi:hypothetical protein
MDIDGDGSPDEPKAIAAVKGLGGAIVGAADAVGGRVAGMFALETKWRVPLHLCRRSIELSCIQTTWSGAAGRGVRGGLQLSSSE